MSAEPRSVHATAVAIGEAGVLLRGPSGAGKSSLALALIESARSAGGYAALVGDDLIQLTVRSGRLLAHGAPSTRGLAEQRALGLLRLPFLGACVIRLVVDLSASPAPPRRLPEPEESVAELEGIAVPRLELTHAFSVGEAARMTLSALALVGATGGLFVDFP